MTRPKARGLLLGTMIRGTQIRGLNHPKNARHVLSNRAHEGLQSSSDPKERKRLKEAHFALGPRPGSTVQPIRTLLEPAEPPLPQSSSPCRGPRRHPAPPLRSRVVLTLLRAPIYVPQAHGSCSFSLRVFPQGLSIHGTNILLCLTKH